MSAESRGRITDAAGPSDLTGLSKLAIASYENLERELRARIEALEVQARRFEAAIDNITQGIGLFDADERLILCNRRYAEIYGIALDRLQPGITLADIVELRLFAGTSPMAGDAYLAFARSINSGGQPANWTAELQDGRTIQIVHRPMPDGGWIATHEDITELAASRVMVSERVSLQALIDWLPDYLWVKDTESRFLVANKALAADHGRQEAGDMIGLNDFDLHAPELARQFRACEQDLMRSGQPMIDREEFILDALGHGKWLSSTKVPLKNAQGEVVGLAGVAHDITQRKLADDLRSGQAHLLEMIAMSAPLEDVLERLVRLIESQLSGIFGSVLLLDADGNHLRHGAAPSLAKQYTDAIDGVRIGPKVGSCGTAAFRREPVIVTDIMRDPLWEDYRELVKPYGYRSCWSTPILSHTGAVLGVFAMYSKAVREPSDVEAELFKFSTRIAGIAIERKLAEDRIHFMANHDTLTGLPNRALLGDRLSQAILYAKRYGRWVSVVFVDLDNFKLVNDTLGHDAGDVLLKTLAGRMTQCVRSTDTVVRLGGDEFVIVLFDQAPEIELVAATLQNIRAAIAEPVHLGNHNLRTTASIGVANYPGDGTTADVLLANADAAMYRAKELGRDHVQFYAPELNSRKSGEIPAAGGVAQRAGARRIPAPLSAAS